MFQVAKAQARQARQAPVANEAIREAVGNKRAEARLGATLLP